MTLGLVAQSFSMPGVEAPSGSRTNSFLGNHKYLSQPSQSDGLTNTYFYYLPLLASGNVAAINDDVTTGIALANPTDRSISVKATAYESAGSPVAGTNNPATITLAPREQVAILDFQLFGWSQSSDSKLGWVLLEATQEIGVLAILFDANFSHSMDGVPAATVVKKQLYFMLSYAGPQSSDRTYFSVCNPNPTPAQVALSLRSATGDEIEAKQITIPANGSYLYPGPSSLRTGYLIVNSDQPLAGSEIYKKAQDSASLGAVAEGKKNDYVFPHFAAGGGYTTNIGLVNPNQRTVQLTLSAFREDGTVIVDGVTRVLLGAQSIYEPVAPMFGLSTSALTTGYIVATSDETGLMGFTDFVYGNNLASSATPIQTSPALTLTFSHLAHQTPAAAGKSWITGIALLNSSSSDSASVRMKVRKADGSEIANTAFTLRPREKASKLLSYPTAGPGFFTQDISIAGGQVEVQSSIPLYGFEMFFTDDVSQIVSVPAQILLESTGSTTGTLSPPANHRADDYEVVSDKAFVNVSATGSFQIATASNEVGSLISQLKQGVPVDQDGIPVPSGYMAVTIGAQESITLNAQSTAEYLVFSSPLLGTRDPERALLVLNTIKSNGQIKALASAIDAAIRRTNTPYDDPSVTAALTDAVLSVLDALPETQQSRQSAQRADGRATSVATADSGNCISVSPIESVCPDIVRMIVEPHPYINAQQHGLKVDTQGPRLWPIDFGTGVNYVIGISELNAADFPQGLADLRAKDRRSTFTLLPQGSGLQEVEIISSSSAFEYLDIIGKIIDLASDALIGTLQPDVGTPVSTTPKIYLIRGFSGSLGVLASDKDEVVFIQDSLSSKEPFNYHLYNASIVDNVAMAVIDGISIVIDINDLIPEGCWNEILKDVTEAFAKGTSDHSVEPTNQYLQDVFLPALGDATSEFIKGIANCALGDPTFVKNRLSELGVAKRGLEAANSILNGLDTIAKIGKGGAFGHRIYHMLRLDPMETSIVVVGNPFLTCTKPSITTHPQSQTISTSQSATLNVIATGTSPLSYQWYRGSKGDTSSPISGATSNSYTTPPLTSTTSYWVRVGNSCGSTDSNTATVTISCTAPTITTHPQSQTISSGQSATLSVVASGTAPLSYQWYRGSKGDTSSPISGATSSSYTTPVLTSSTSYWVRVSNSCGSVDGNTATVTLSCVPPTITTHPQSTTINSGQSATLSIVASGTAPLSYQWYRGSRGDTSSPISGATSSSYTTPALTSTTSYWVRVSNVCGSADSSAATVTVTSGTTQWLTFVEGNPGVPGDGILIDARGGNITDDFEMITPFALGSLTDGFTITLFPSGGHNINQSGFRVSVKTPGHPCIDFNTTVGIPVTGTMTCNGQGFLSSYNQDALQFLPTILNTIPFRGCNVTLKDLSITSLSMREGANSNAVYVLDAAALLPGQGTFPTCTCTKPSITIHPQSTMINSGQSAMLNVAATGVSPLSYQWYRGSKGDTSSPISGATSSSYTTPPLTSTTSYWVRVSDVCGSADSSAATVIVTSGTTQWLTFVEGNPGVPGDGITISASGGINPNRFEISPQFALSGVSNGLTVAVFPTPQNFNSVWLLIYRSSPR
jgi:hypothetical protein